jgi:hypothetical protein
MSIKTKWTFLALLSYLHKLILVFRCMFNPLWLPGRLNRKLRVKTLALVRCEVLLNQNWKLWRRKFWSMLNLWHADIFDFIKHIAVLGDTWDEYAGWQKGFFVFRLWQVIKDSHLLVFCRNCCWEFRLGLARLYDSLSCDRALHLLIYDLSLVWRI